MPQEPRTLPADFNPNAKVDGPKSKRTLPSNFNLEGKEVVINEPEQSVGDVVPKAKVETIDESTTRVAKMTVPNKQPDIQDLTSVEGIIERANKAVSFSKIPNPFLDKKAVTEAYLSDPANADIKAKIEGHDIISFKSTPELRKHNAYVQGANSILDNVKKQKDIAEAAVIDDRVKLAMMYRNLELKYDVIKELPVNEKDQIEIAGPNQQKLIDDFEQLRLEIKAMSSTPEMSKALQAEKALNIAYKQYDKALNVNKGPELSVPETILTRIIGVGARNSTAALFDSVKDMALRSMVEDDELAVENEKKIAELQKLIDSPDASKSYNIHETQGQRAQREIDMLQEQISRTKVPEYIDTRLSNFMYLASDQMSKSLKTDASLLAMEHKRDAGFGDADYYLHDLPEGLGSSLSMLGAGIIATALTPEITIPAGATLATRMLYGGLRALKVGAKAATIDRPIEAFMEMGSTYSEGMDYLTSQKDAEGNPKYTLKEANTIMRKHGNRVLLNNVLLFPLEVLQYGLAFAPIAKWGRMAGAGNKLATAISTTAKLSLNSVSEGYVEENYQGLLQWQEKMKLQGKLPSDADYFDGYEEWTKTEEYRMSVRVGVGIGALLGGGGEVFNYIETRNQEAAEEASVIEDVATALKEGKLDVADAGSAKLRVGLFARTAIYGNSEALIESLRVTREQTRPMMTEDENKAEDEKFLEYINEINEFATQAKGLNSLLIDDMSKKQILILDAHGKKLKVAKDEMVAYLKSQGVNAGVISQQEASFQSAIEENERTIKEISKDGVRNYLERLKAAEESAGALPTEAAPVTEVDNTAYPETTPEQATVNVIDEKLKKQFARNKSSATTLEDLMADAPETFTMIVAKARSGKNISKKYKDEAVEYIKEKQAALEALELNEDRDFLSDDIKKAREIIDDAAEAFGLPRTVVPVPAPAPIAPVAPVAPTAPAPGAPAPVNTTAAPVVKPAKKTKEERAQEEYDTVEKERKQELEEVSYLVDKVQKKIFEDDINSKYDKRLEKNPVFKKSQKQKADTDQRAALEKDKIEVVTDAAKLTDTNSILQVGSNEYHIKSGKKNGAVIKAKTLKEAHDRLLIERSREKAMANRKMPKSKKQNWKTDRTNQGVENISVVGKKLEEGGRMIVKDTKRVEEDFEGGDYFVVINQHTPLTLNDGKMTNAPEVDVMGFVDKTEADRYFKYREKFVEGLLSEQTAEINKIHDAKQAALIPKKEKSAPVKKEKALPLREQPETEEEKERRLKRLAEDAAKSKRKAKSRQRRINKEIYAFSPTLARLMKAEPSTLEEIILKVIRGGWKINEEEFKSETGYGVDKGQRKGIKSPEEFKKRKWMTDPDGESLHVLETHIQEIVHGTLSSEDKVSQGEIKQAILDVIDAHDTKDSFERALEEAFTVDGKVVTSKDERAELLYEKEMQQRYGASSAEEAAEMEKAEKEKHKLKEEDLKNRLIENKSTTVVYQSGNRTITRTWSQVGPSKDGEGYIDAIDSERSVGEFEGKKFTFKLDRLQEIVSEESREEVNPDQDLLDELAELKAEQDALKKEANETPPDAAPLAANLPLGNKYNRPVDQKRFQNYKKQAIVYFKLGARKTGRTIEEFVKSLKLKSLDEFIEFLGLKESMEIIKDAYDEAMAEYSTKYDKAFGHFKTKKQRDKEIDKRTEEKEKRKGAHADEKVIGGDIALAEVLNDFRNIIVRKALSGKKQGAHYALALSKINKSSLSGSEKETARKDFNTAVLPHLQGVKETRVETIMALRELGWNESDIEDFTDENSMSFTDVGNDREVNKVKYLYSPRNEQNERIGLKDKNGDVIPENKIADMIWFYTKTLMTNPVSHIDFYKGLPEASVAEQLGKFTEGELRTLFNIMSSTIRMPFSHINTSVINEANTLQLLPSNREKFDTLLIDSLIEVARKKFETTDKDVLEKQFKTMKAGDDVKGSINWYYKNGHDELGIAPFKSKLATLVSDYDYNMMQVSSATKTEEQKEVIRKQIDEVKAKIRPLLQNVIRIEAHELYKLTGVGARYWEAKVNVDKFMNGYVNSQNQYQQGYLSSHDTISSGLKAFVYGGTKKKPIADVDTFWRRLTVDKKDEDGKVTAISQITSMVRDMNSNKEIDTRVRHFSSVEGSLTNADIYISTIDILAQKLPTESIQNSSFVKDNLWAKTFSKEAPRLETFEGQKNGETKLNSSTSDINRHDLLVAMVMNFINPVKRDRYMQFFDQQKDFNAKTTIEAPIYSVGEARTILDGMKPKGMSKEAWDKHIAFEEDKVFVMLSAWQKSSNAILPLKGMSLGEVAKKFTYNYLVNKRGIDDFFQPETSSTGVLNYDSYSDKTKRAVINRGWRLDARLIREKMGELHGNPLATDINMVVMADPIQSFLGFEKQKISDGIYFVRDKSAEILQEAAGTIINIDKTYKFTYSNHDENGVRTFIKGHGVKLTKSLANMNETYAAIYKYMEDNNIDFLAFDSAVKKYDREGKGVKAKWSEKGVLKSIPAYLEKNQIKVDPDFLLVQQNLKQSEEFEALKATRQQFYYAMRFSGSDRVQSILNDIVDERYQEFMKEFLEETEEYQKQFILAQLSDNSDKYDFYKEFLNHKDSSLNGSYFHGLMKNLFAGYVRNEILKIDISKQIGIEAPLLGTFKNEKGEEVELKEVRIENGVIKPGQGLFPAAYKNQGYKEGNIVFINRVPGTELHSTTPVEIVGFLPDDVGNLIMTDQLTRIRSGSDYDGDLRHIWSHFRNDKHEIITTGYKGKINEILDIMMSDFLGKNITDKKALQEHFEMLTMPIDTKANETIIKKHIIRKEKNYSKDSLQSFLNKVEASQDGKFTISIGARMGGAIESLLHKFDATLKSAVTLPYFRLDENGKPVVLKKDEEKNTVYFNFNHSDFTTQQKVRGILANMLNHSTDNSSLGMLDPMGVNRYTVSLAYTLAMLNYEENQLHDFLNHPVVTEYVRLSRLYSSPHLKKTKKNIFQIMKNSTGSNMNYDPSGPWKFKYKDLYSADMLFNSPDAKLKLISMLDYMLSIAESLGQLGSLEKLGDEPVTDYYEFDKAVRTYDTIDLGFGKFIQKDILNSDYLTNSKIGINAFEDIGLNYYPVFTRLGGNVYAEFSRMMGIDQNMGNVASEGVIEREMNKQFAIDALGITKSKEQLAKEAKDVYDDFPEGSIFKDKANEDGTITPGLFKWDEKNNRLSTQLQYQKTLNESEVKQFRAEFAKLSKQKGLGEDEPYKILLEHQVLEYGWSPSPRSGEYASFMDVGTHVAMSKKMDKQFDKWNSADQYSNENNDNPVINSFVKQIQLSNIQLIPEVKLEGKKVMKTYGQSEVRSGAGYVKVKEGDGYVIYNLNELIAGNRKNGHKYNPSEKPSPVQSNMFVDTIGGKTEVAQAPKPLRVQAEGLFNPNATEKDEKGNIVPKAPINIWSSEKNGFELLSNYKTGSIITDIEWKTGRITREFETSEHLYQFQKALFFKDYNAAAKIFKASSPSSARVLGNSEIEGFDADVWSKVSFVEMEKLLRQAFSQNANQLELLKKTGDALLTHSSGDEWATKFPLILMKIRQEAKEGKFKATAKPKVATIKKQKADGYKTENGHVKIVASPWEAQKRGEGIAVIRGKSDKHYGNPFGTTKNSKHQLIMRDTVAEATDDFKSWVDGTYVAKEGEEAILAANEERRQWIAGKIKDGSLKGKTLLYYKELGERSHANALDELINGDSTTNTKVNPKDTGSADVSGPGTLPLGVAEMLAEAKRKAALLTGNKKPKGPDLFDSAQKQRGATPATVPVIKVAQALTDKLNVRHTFITPEQALEFTNGKWDGESGFYHNGHVYLVDGYLAADTQMHEFTHPMVDALFQFNPDLARNLVSELDEHEQGAIIRSAVEKLYPEHFINGKPNEIAVKEMLTRAITHDAMKAQESKANRSEFRKLIDKIWAAIKETLNLKGKIDIATLKSDTTIADLAGYLTDDSTVELHMDNIAHPSDVQFIKIDDIGGRAGRLISNTKIEEDADNELQRKVDYIKRVLFGRTISNRDFSRRLKYNHIKQVFDNDDYGTPEQEKKAQGLTFWEYQYFKNGPAPRNLEFAKTNFEPLNLSKFILYFFGDAAHAEYFEKGNADLMFKMNKEYARYKKSNIIAQKIMIAVSNEASTKKITNQQALEAVPWDTMLRWITSLENNGARYSAFVLDKLFDVYVTKSIGNRMKREMNNGTLRQMRNNGTPAIDFFYDAYKMIVGDLEYDQNGNPLVHLITEKDEHGKDVLDASGNPITKIEQQRTKTIEPDLGTLKSSLFLMGTRWKSIVGMSSSGIQFMNQLIDEAGVAAETQTLRANAIINRANKFLQDTGTDSLEDYIIDATDLNGKTTVYFVNKFLPYAQWNLNNLTAAENQLLQNLNTPGLSAFQIEQNERALANTRESIRKRKIYDAMISQGNDPSVMHTYTTPNGKQRTVRLLDKVPEGVTAADKLFYADLKDEIEAKIKDILKNKTSDPITFDNLKKQAVLHFLQTHNQLMKDSEFGNMGFNNLMAHAVPQTKADAYEIATREGLSKFFSNRKHIYYADAEADHYIDNIFVDFENKKGEMFAGRKMQLFEIKEDILLQMKTGKIGLAKGARKIRTAKALAKAILGKAQNAKEGFVEDDNKHIVTAPKLTPPNGARFTKTNYRTKNTVATLINYYQGLFLKTQLEDVVPLLEYVANRYYGEKVSNLSNLQAVAQKILRHDVYGEGMDLENTPGGVKYAEFWKFMIQWTLISRLSGNLVSAKWNFIAGQINFIKEYTPLGYLKLVAGIAKISKGGDLNWFQNLLRMRKVLLNMRLINVREQAETSAGKERMTVLNRVLFILTEVVEMANQMPFILMKLDTDVFDDYDKKGVLLPGKKGLEDVNGLRYDIIKDLSANAGPYGNRTKPIGSWDMMGSLTASLRRWQISVMDEFVGEERMVNNKLITSHLATSKRIIGKIRGSKEQLTGADRKQLLKAGMIVLMLAMVMLKATSDDDDEDKKDDKDLARMNDTLLQAFGVDDYSIIGQMWQATGVAGVGIDFILFMYELLTQERYHNSSMYGRGQKTVTPINPAQDGSVFTVGPYTAIEDEGKYVFEGDLKAPKTGSRLLPYGSIVREYLRQRAEADKEEIDKLLKDAEKAGKIK